MTAEWQRTAVVFPGQGAQHVGMAQDFCKQFPVSRQTFEEASEALGLDLQALCFAEDARLNLTEFTQPALLTAELAMLRALQSEYGLHAQYFGGHSLGEYTALCAAGVIELADAVRLVRQRGALMQAAVPKGRGAMLALIADPVSEQHITSLLEGLDVDVANVNSADQLVLSGDASAMPAAAERLSDVLTEGGRLVTLKVSAPFHSRMMRVVEAGLFAALSIASERFVLERATRVTSNFTGDFHTAERKALVDALVHQAAAPVQWIANMTALAQVATRIVEVGPGRTLRAFFQKTLGRGVSAVGSVRAAGKELTL